MNERLGGLTLERVPAQPKQPLRAWDAADELVLSHFDESPPQPGARLLIVNDAFGALACSLRHLGPMVINESAAGGEAIRANLAANALDDVAIHSMLELVSGSLVGPFDVVIVKIPKATAQLVDLFHRLRPLVHAGTRVVGACMVKHLHRTAVDTFEELIGPTTTSRAVKKARLVHAEVDEALLVGANPYPTRWSASGFELINHGGGFSPISLDIGTSALLDGVQNFADYVDAERDNKVDEKVGSELRAVDLGCGNGIVGLRMACDLAADGRDVLVEAVDDSFLAIDSTKQAWALADLAATVQLHHHHRLVHAVEPKTVDLVVVNPPFHNDRVVGDHTAWSMFTDAHRALRSGGALIVVGNRHLAYHAKLMKIFGNAQTIASNAKFVVLLSRR